MDYSWRKASKLDRYKDNASPVTNWMKMEDMENGIYRLRINAVQFPLELPQATGKLLLVVGDIDIPIAMAVGAKYPNMFGAIAFLQKEKYIIVISHDPNFEVGAEKTHMEIFP